MLNPNEASERSSGFDEMIMTLWYSELEISQSPLKKARLAISSDSCGSWVGVGEGVGVGGGVNVSVAGTAVGGGGDGSALLVWEQAESMQNTMGNNHRNFRAVFSMVDIIKQGMRRVNSCRFFNLLFSAVSQS